MAVAVLATSWWCVRIAGRAAYRVLCRMPATVLLATLGLAWLASALLATTTTTASTTASAAALSPDSTAAVRLVGLGSGGGDTAQCGSSGCGGGSTPRAGDPIRGGASPAGSGNSGGGVLDWAGSSVLGLDASTSTRMPDSVDKLRAPAHKADRFDKPGKPELDKLGNPDQARRPDPGRTGNPDQPGGSPELTRGRLAGWATGLPTKPDDTIEDAVTHTIGSGKLGEPGGKPELDKPAAPGLDQQGGRAELANAGGRLDEPGRRDTGRVDRWDKAGLEQSRPDQLGRLGEADQLGERLRLAPRDPRVVYGQYDSGGGLTDRPSPRGEQVVLAGAAAGGAGSAAGGGQRTRTGPAGNHRSGADFEQRISRVLGQAFERANGHVTNEHQQRMRWLASAHGDDNDRSGRASGGNSNSSDSSSARASGDATGSSVAGTRSARVQQPNDAELGSPINKRPSTPDLNPESDQPLAAGSRARLVKGGTRMAVPTSDGGQLTIDPTTSSRHSTTTPELDDGRYLITARKVQAPSSYDFHLDTPKGSRAVANDQGNALTPHIGFSENAALPVIADPATKPAAKPASAPENNPAPRPKKEPAPAPAVVDAKGKNFRCENCSASTIDVGSGTPGPDTGQSDVQTGNDQHTVVVNAGASAQPPGRATPPAQPRQQGQSHPPPLISPYLKSVESGIQNYLGKYSRYERTQRDAATRHLVATDQYHTLATKLQGSKVPGAKAAAGLANRYGDYRAVRAQWHGSQSQRLGEISRQTMANTPVRDWFKRNHATVWDPKKGAFVNGRVGRLGITNVGLTGYLPRDRNNPMRSGWRKALPTQRVLSATLADRFNRYQEKPLNPLRKGKPNPAPGILSRPSVRAARAANPGFPVTTDMARAGGLRVAETARRGLTKVSGPVALALGTADVANQIRDGVKPGEAIGKTGSSIGVSAAAAAATTAALSTAAAAAFVPGPGWAVAGGIGAGIGASYAWEHLGGADPAAKAGGWIQGEVTEGAKAVTDRAKVVGNGAKAAFRGAKKFFGFG